MLDMKLSSSMRNSEFPEGTAGNRMITAFPRVKTRATVRSIEEMLVKRANAFDTMYYVYIVDEDNVLQGVISVKELLTITNKDVKVEDVVKRELVVVDSVTDQEEVVYRALSHNIKSIPVVNRENHLLGIVPYDTPDI